MERGADVVQKKYHDKVIRRKSVRSMENGSISESARQWPGVQRRDFKV
jgi:hypothetical protein